ncbi:MAG: mitochondrial fission ELM1 family protein [Magnetospirillum sp.]|nr:mitochondrial fission ELM1 family protein [Magnetospirillum sp.]
MSHRDGAPVWVLADDRTGDVAQCLGVAEAIDLPFVVKDVAYEKLAVLHNIFRGPTLMGITPASRARLVPPWPRLVIACGRRTSPVARWIKRRSGAAVAQIMDPGPGGRSGIDLFAVPAHDAAQLPEDKVVRILGAPHRVTPERLAEAALRWRPHWAHLPRPWVAAIVGASTRHRVSPLRQMRQLGEQVSALAAREGGSVLLTTSRRTGAAAERALLSAIGEPRYVHRWGGAGENPFFAMIALADAVVVTGDSTSMCTEATSCPGGVYIWSPPGWVMPKHARMHEDFYAGGYARPLDGVRRLESWAHHGLNPAATIADAIRTRLRVV